MNERLAEALKAVGCEWYMIRRCQAGIMLVTDKCIDPKSDTPRHVQITKKLGLYRGPHGSDYVMLRDSADLACGSFPIGEKDEVSG